jgi:hypothetical protein
VIDTEPTRLKEVTVSVVPDSSLKQEKCNAVLGLVVKPVEKELVDKDPLANELPHKQGISRVYVVLEAKGNSAKCYSDQSLVKFTFDVPGEGSKVLERPISISVDWKPKPPIWLVWGIVAIALLIVALLNLLLLREIKKYTSKMAKSGLFAFEVPVSISRMRTGQLLVKTREGAELSSVQFNVDDQFAVRIEGDRRHAKFMGGSRSSLKVKLPSLFKPFAAPLLVLDSKKSVYYAPNFEGGSGLSPLTRQAVIIHSPVPSDETCEAIVSLLIPNTGMGREQIVRDLLGSKLNNAIKPAANDSDWFSSSVVQPAGANASTPVQSNAGEGSDSARSSGDDDRRPPRPGPR